MKNATIIGRVLIFLSFLSINSFAQAQSDPIYGCIYSNMFNYNANATIDDGSCYIIVTGCVDINALNFNDIDGDGYSNELTGINGTDVNTDDGSCIAKVFGCLHEDACNYNTYANTDTGDCIYATDLDECSTCSGETDGTGIIIDNDSDNDGVCDADELLGCTVESACNYDSTSTIDTDNTLCIYAVDLDSCATCSGETDGTGTIIDNDSDNDGVCNVDEIVGCQDITACNYNTEATDSDSCIYSTDLDACATCSGETDGSGIIIDNDSDLDGVCDSDEVIGCQDATACNYNTEATDAGDCIYSADLDACATCSGETNGTGTIVANDSDNDGVCDADEVIGCQDVTACNYMVLATDSDHCIYSTDLDVCASCSGETDGTGVVIDNDLDNDAVCNTDELEGCMQVWADNYNELATDSDGSCFKEGCLYDLYFNYDPIATVDDGSCIEYYYDCIDIDACNYNQAANTDNGSCIYSLDLDACAVCSGETEGTGIIIDNDADNDSVCDADEVVGCQDITACNFMILATDSGDCIYSTDLDLCATCSGETDGSGIIVDNDSDNDVVCDANEIIGCQDITACNYMLLATDSDECIYSTDLDVCATCSGETDGTGVIVDNDTDNDGVCDSEELIGCTDETACNYDATSTTDADNTLCIYSTDLDFCATCSGETDGTGVIVDNDADNDSVCNTEELIGCTDDTACNYDATSTTDTDNSLCVYSTDLDLCATCSGETDGSGIIVDNDSDNDGVCDTDEVVGCQDITACNYMGLATDSDECIYSTDLDACATCSGETDGTGVIVDNDADNDGVCDSEELIGCSDETACNYDATSTTDTDNTLCIYSTDLDVCATCSGETDGSGVIVDNDSDNDGVCDSEELIGCTDETACNYDATSTTDTDNTLCVYSTDLDACATCSGETDGSGIIVDNDSDNDGVCDADEVVGCQDVSACNYMSLATDAGECIIPVDCESCSGDTDGAGVIIDNDLDDDGVCNADEILGCVYTWASNYNEYATEDDGSCFTVIGCMYQGMFNYNPEANYDDGSCYPVIEGCTNSDACNFISLIYDDHVDVNTEDGSCILPVGCESCSGEIDGTGVIVDNDSDDDEVCNSNEVIGCQDITACNYMVLATDAGDCIYSTDLDACATCSGATDGTGTIVANDSDNDGVCNAEELIGCTDDAACNYNAQSTDEGVCIYSTDLDACATCSGETDGSGVIVDNDADNDSVCDADEVVGCQDSTACNYNTAATDAGDCIYSTDLDACATCSGATDGSGIIVNNDSDNDGVCDADEVVGCQDITACNYMVLATDSDTCTYSTDLDACATCSGATDGTGTIVANDSDNDGVCNAEELIGCTDETACNYDATSTTDTVSTLCIYSTDLDVCATCSGETDGTGTIVDNDSDNDGVCDAIEIVGCQDITACNYNTAATDAGDCIYSTDLDACATCSGATDGSGIIVDNDSDNDSVCDTDELVGCQDITACNYMDLATDSDSCTYSADLDACATCSGATDGTGIIVANDSDNDGICNDNEIEGCTDDLACNYDATSTTDSDNTLCIYSSDLDFCATCSGETDGTGTIVDNDSDNDGVCDAIEIVGCQDITACNYNTAATDAGDCIYSTDLDACATCSGETDGSGVIVNNDIDNDGVCDADEILGCTFDWADNYNEFATDNDSSCLLNGCSYDVFFNFNTNVTTDNGSCFEYILGCTNPDACNYIATVGNPYIDVNTDDGSCIIAEGCDSCSGETDGTGTIVANDSDNDGVCNFDEILGCTDDTACNYDATSTTDTDSTLCIYSSDLNSCATCSGETDGTGTIVDNDVDNDGVCNAIEVTGCQDSTACNYNTVATDPGDCIYSTDLDSCATCSGESDGTGTIVDNDLDEDGICDIDEVVGCQDETACNYNDLATDADNSCVYTVDLCSTCENGVLVIIDSDNDGVCDLEEVFGCTEDWADNYNSLNTEEDSSCYKYGCTYEWDFNYDSFATEDPNNECIETIEGCTNPAACNFIMLTNDSNVDVNTDDGSCSIPEGCDTCSEATDGTGYIIDNDADDDGVCDADELSACTDDLACNYDATPTTDTDNTLCIYSIDLDACATCSGATDGTGVIVDNDSDNDGICDADEVTGCQDEAACNYMTLATDAGDCIYSTDLDACATCSGETDGTGTIVDNDSDNDGLCNSEDVVSGCTDVLACNYNASLTLNQDLDYCEYVDGICQTCQDGIIVNNDSDNDAVCNADEVLGCTYTWGYNFNPLATDDDGSCYETPVWGCTETEACNYSVNATDNDQSCLYVDNICETCENGFIIDNDLDNDGVCDLDELDGCTDEYACNYDATSTTDTNNILCEYPVDCDSCSGEQDGSGVIVDNDSDNDGVCDSEELIGCTDETACNYDATSTTDTDNTLCDYSTDLDACATCSGETNGTGTIVDNDLDDDGVCNQDEISDCTDLIACNYNPISTIDTDNTLCQYASEFYDCNDVCLSDIDNDGVCDQLEVYGCTLDWADNYMSEATEEDGSCYREGCMYNLYFNYDSIATMDAGNCIQFSYGCIDASACNYNDASNTDNGSCIYSADLDACATCSGQTNGFGYIVDNDLDNDGVCDEDEIIGCTNPTACNYDSDLTTDTDNSLCIYSTDLDVCASCSGEVDGTGVIVDNDADNDGVCNADEVIGCQDITACNYMIYATDTGDCIYSTDLDACATCSGETDGSGSIIDNDSDDDGVCDTDEVIGCQDITACNYMVLATDFGTCTYSTDLDACATCSGATDGTGVIVDNDSDHDGVCDINEVVGCQDELACDYNYLATDSGDCIIPVGCETCLDVEGIQAQIDALNTSITDLEIQNSSVESIDVDSLNTVILNLESEIIELESEVVYLNNILVNSSSSMQAIVQTQIDNATSQLVTLQSQLSDANSELNQSGSNSDSELQIANANLEIDSLQNLLNTGLIIDNDSDDDGVCNSDEIVGCQDETACNYMILATDAGDCIYSLDLDACASCSGDTDGTGVIIDNDVDNDGVCDTNEIVGCQDEEACNYMVLATDPGNCFIPTDCESCTGETDGTGSIVYNDSDNDGYCDLSSGISPEEILGCNLSWADNYNPNTTEEDNESCYRYGCMYPTMLNFDALATADPSLACSSNSVYLEAEIQEAESVLTTSFEEEISILTVSFDYSLDSLQSIIDGLNMDLTTALDSISTLVNLNTSQFNQITTLQNEVDSLELVIDVKIQEIIDLTEVHTAAINVLISEHSLELSALESLTNSLVLNLENQISTLEIDVDSLNSINISNQDTIFSLMSQLENCTSDPIMVDLIEGWNLIGFTLPEPQDLVASFSEIDDLLQIVKDNSGASYLPEWDFNGIGDLIPGQGYQLKITESVNEFTFPLTEMRYELNPTVPQWALDMEIDLHPNDIRTLIRVVNELGQEVDPETTPNGTVLFYIYNDASVEKYLKN